MQYLFWNRACSKTNLIQVMKISTYVNDKDDDDLLCFSTLIEEDEEDEYIVDNAGIASKIWSMVKTIKIFVEQ